MKDATGELSTTVIAVVAIAAIATIFTVFLLPQMKSSIILNQACSNGPGYEYVSEDKSYAVGCPGTKTGGATTTWTCYYKTSSSKAASVGNDGKPSGDGAEKSKICSQN